MGTGIPIYHLASHARAGETLVLKLLSEHSRVFVPLQIQKEESKVDQAFISEVQNTGIRSIELSHSYARQSGLSSEHIILVKQGVWLHRHPFDGFTLVRNPQSFVASMLTYNVREGLDWGFRPYGRKRYAKTFKRLLRWSQNMSEELCREIESKRSVIDALCCFYNSRIATLSSYRKTIFKYEDLIMSPLQQLQAMCLELDIKFEDALLDAHLNYPAAKEGHGMNDLSRPIDAASMTKWRQGHESVKLKVKDQTLEAAQSVGYTYDEIYLNDA